MTVDKSSEKHTDEKAAPSRTAEEHEGNAVETNGQPSASDLSSTSVQNLTNSTTLDQKEASPRVDETDEDNSDAEKPATLDFKVMVHDDSALSTLEGNSSASNIAPSQSASIPSAPSTTTNSISQQDPRQQKQQVKRRRKSKRGHIVRRAQLEIGNTPLKKKHAVAGLSLPSNQYETTLIRRAIRKPNHSSTQSSSSEQSSHKANQEILESEQEVYGDISLGMKLSVVGGKVIVQMLNALTDGRASPAQLAGVIQRGDVLCAINGKNLVNLPIDQLMNGLGPLSTPDATGSYQRCLHLRFVAGEGLDLLNKSESAQEKLKVTESDDSRNRPDPASDVFALFPMVDQLSGMPLFESHQIDQQGPFKKEATPSTPVATIDSTSASVPLPVLPSLSVNDSISRSLENLRRKEQIRYLSEYFAWSSEIGLLMTQGHQESDKQTIERTNDGEEDVNRILDLGRKALLGARALGLKLEHVDSGKDMRSFHSWNSNLSLYSRASTRRRFVFDTDSLPVNIGRVIEEESDQEDDDQSGKSGASQEGEQLDGDELLVRLAAHDDIWRKQVVEFLETSTEERSADQDNAPLPQDNALSTDMDSALSTELGSFLFGEKMTQILTENKKSQALPQEDITAVLFDLATKLSSSVPDEMTTAGSDISYRSSLVPFIGMKRPRPGSDLMLANRFLLDEALPAWLKTFKPLPWEQRRVLWPLDKAPSSGSTVATTLSDDSLTIDSMNTGNQSPGTRLRKRKNLRERIEDQELNAETRAETCFLVTYFFSQCLLPKLINPKKSVDSATPARVFEEILNFITHFGAYLKMPTCIAYASILKADSVIYKLLEVAKHDPRHKEVVKQLSKGTTLIFYEPTMLSAVIQRLYSINEESSWERKRATVDLCASAYPDVRVWQVREHLSALTSSKGDASGNLYYSYLSLLLHPLDGHDAARRDKALVREWCDLSVEGKSVEGLSIEEKEERLKNFFCVASRTSSDHLSYDRDRVHLLHLSMKIREYSLALDLAGEILDNSNTSRDKNALRSALDSLRTIGLDAVENLYQGGNAYRNALRRIFRLYRRFSVDSLSMLAARKVINVPEEIKQLIVASNHKNKTISQVEELLQFLAMEANSFDMLRALALFTREHETGIGSLLAILKLVLQRGALANTTGELSTSLLRLRRGREVQVEKASREESEPSSQTIWKQMSNGMITVSK